MPVYCRKCGRKLIYGSLTETRECLQCPVWDRWWGIFTGWSGHDLLTQHDRPKAQPPKRYDAMTGERVQ